MNPSVSIIITTYNRPKYLSRAVDSALSQSANIDKVIVVDDNNPNTIARKETENLILKYKHLENFLYVKHGKNKNASAARNTGMKFVDSTYVCFLDDDDEYKFDKIEKEMNMLEKMGEDYGFVYCGYSNFRNGIKIYNCEPNKLGILTKELFMKTWSVGSGSTPLYRTSVVKEINGFDESYKRHQDWEFILRIFRNYKVCVVREKLVNIYKDDTINHPKVLMYIKIKEKFFEDFKNDIQALPLDVQNSIYKIHWLEIAKEFIIANNYKEAIEFFKKAKAFNKVTIKEKAYLLYILIFSRFSFHYKIIDIIRCGKIKILGDK